MKIVTGNLNQEQIERFINWKNDIDPNQEKELTFEGQNEMVLLAERMLRRFPNAIQSSYNNNSFLVSFIHILHII